MKRKKRIEAFDLSGIIHYVWYLDVMAGRKNVFTVLALNSEDPVVIGRELPQDVIRPLIAEYEKEAQKLQNKGVWHFGERNFVLTVRNKVTGKRGTLRS